MSRRSATFTQADLTRAVKGTMAAGVNVLRVEIDKSGKIVVVVAGRPVEEQDDTNEWDKVNGDRPA